MKKTVSIQIGNTDDNLSQRQWHDFYSETNAAIVHWADAIHFSGASENHQPWQNAAWFVELKAGVERRGLRRELADIRKKYNQDSTAWTEGETEFV